MKKNKTAALSKAKLPPNLARMILKSLQSLIGKAQYQPSARHVWGIGLARTGTTSLCKAFKILGYARVGHNPEFEELKYLNAAADNGCTLYYKYLDFIRPNSKFILTTRDLDSWLISMEDINQKSPALTDLAVLRRMSLYESVKFDRDKMTAAYHRHSEAVARYFQDRPSDLLIMNLIKGEGWEKLCPFLGLPVPKAPFPHLNKAVASNL